MIVVANSLSAEYLLGWSYQEGWDELLESIAVLREVEPIAFDEIGHWAISRNKKTIRKLAELPYSKQSFEFSCYARTIEGEDVG
jgi:hypothetical protein